MNFKLGPEAPLLWNTIKMTKRQYPKEHGGAELRGQTRALAYRYMRYIYGSKDFSDNTLREFMEQHKEERVRKDKESRKHENVLADVIREALDKEEVSNIPFNKNHITDQQMKLIMLKAATTQDQLQLFYLLVDEVTEEFLNDRDVPLAKRAVEEEIIRRENDQLFNMDPILSTYTLRQLRDELKRYGKDESEFRAELSKLPDVESPAIRGVLRKQCLISILLEQRTIHGHLQKDQARVAQAPTARTSRLLDYRALSALPQISHSLLPSAHSCFGRLSKQSHAPGRGSFGPAPLQNKRTRAPTRMSGSGGVADSRRRSSKASLLPEQRQTTTPTTSSRTSRTKRSSTRTFAAS